jgi:hypothetical protein
MKFSSLRWALFGLVVIAAVGYALSKGLYVGSAIDVSAREGADKLIYSKSCRYLHFDGVHGTIGVETHSREDAESTSCVPLEPSN